MCFFFVIYLSFFFSDYHQENITMVSCSIWLSRILLKLMSATFITYSIHSHFKIAKVWCINLMLKLFWKDITFRRSVWYVKYNDEKKKCGNKIRDTKQWCSTCTNIIVVISRKSVSMVSCFSVFVDYYILLNCDIFSFMILFCRWATRRLFL